MTGCGQYVKSQKKKHSMLEVILNTTIGYVIAICSQLLIFPVFNIHIPLSHNLMIGLFFTVVSLIRSYYIRRLFNWFHIKGIL